ncbi:hypothetical protein ACT691_01980 [Vibrio metschnikovii]
MTDQINLNDDTLELLDALEIGCELSHYSILRLMTLSEADDYLTLLVRIMIFICVQNNHYRWRFSFSQSQSHNYLLAIRAQIFFTLSVERWAFLYF